MLNFSTPKSWSKLKEIVGKCDRCGACLPVCPLFGAKDLELSGARGKNTLARAFLSDVLPADKNLLAAVNFCLLCRACVENCPSNVKTDEAMIEMRQYLLECSGASNMKYRLVGGLLKSRELTGIAAFILALFRRLGLNGLLPPGMVPEEYGRRQFLTAMAGPAALAQASAAPARNISSAKKVAYFFGCGMRLMFPTAAADSLHILRSGTSVATRNNYCCGLPHLAHGLRRDFLKLAQRNIILYENDDLVVTDCGSCGSTLKNIASFFKGDPVWENRAQSFGAKVMDISEYLVAVGYQPRAKLKTSLTYHDACHLRRGQGIVRAPRALLAAAGDYVEMEQADQCCGGAGSFHLDYPEIAAHILAKKSRNIEKTGASLVVAGCPGCLIQLTKAAKASGGKFQALHLSQVI